MNPIQGLPQIPSQIPWFPRVGSADQPASRNRRAIGCSALSPASRHGAGGASSSPRGTANFVGFWRLRTSYCRLVHPTYEAISVDPWEGFDSPRLPAWRLV